MSTVHRSALGIGLVAGWVILLGLFLAAPSESAPPPEAVKAKIEVPERPKVPGTFRLTLRERKDGVVGQARPTERTSDWQVAETAIIVIDMWDDIYCQMAAHRINVMAPKMNQVLMAARDHGALIIHGPSSTVDLYTDTPFRQRALAARPAKAPFDVTAWCYLDKAREPELPVDTSKCACDDPILTAVVRKYTRQHPAIVMAGYDSVTDNGQEVFNLLKQEGIKNVAIMGVHTNMCVLGRSFGIRQMVKLGFNVALVRDLTDTLYDPRQPPYVSHTRGTELVVEHIERYWCPSIISGDLTRVVPGSSGPKGDR